jgi:hypothetical protein
VKRYSKTEERKLHFKNDILNKRKDILLKVQKIMTVSSLLQDNETWQVNDTVSLKIVMRFLIGRPLARY